ncbi:MAG: hypothetical protein WAV31_00835 [Candidatus Moraniibacteriota bacterium]
MKKTLSTYLLVLVLIALPVFFISNNVYAVNPDEQEMIEICTPIANEIAEKKFGYVVQETPSSLNDVEMARDIAIDLQKKDIFKKQENEINPVVGADWLSSFVEKIKNIKLFNEL